MASSELKVQVFQTVAQWESGLLHGLKFSAREGLTLFSKPAFVEWFSLGGQVKTTAALFVEDCKQVYFIDSQTCHLHRFDAIAKRLESISDLSGFGSAPGELKNPGRMVADASTLWILDAENRRVLAFSREPFQIKYIIDKLKEPLDIALDRLGFLYVLDRRSSRIHKFEVSGRHLMSFGQGKLTEPIVLAVGKGHKIYVVDRQFRGFRRFTESGEYEDHVGRSFDVKEDEYPSHFSIDQNGNLFVSYRRGQTVRLHEFDPDGLHLGGITLPANITEIHAIAFGGAGELYLSTDQGIAYFNAQKNFTAAPGTYYSKTLDNGQENQLWHRLDLIADVPERTSLKVSYCSSDDVTLKNNVDKIFALPAEPLEEKVKSLEQLLEPLWEVHEKVRNGIFFQKRTGRYLWLKIELATFDEERHPAVSAMKVYYPRISYLRYLPPIYQEDAVGRDFLERFLSIFETVFSGLENEISTLFKYFDPEIAPKEFLDWLASWLNLAVEEAWPEELKRHLIAKAHALFKKKGTVAGIADFVELLTGRRPLIVEHARSVPPMILTTTGRLRLGIDSFLHKTPARGFRLGDSAMLGYSALREVAQAPEDPFLSLAHRFVVLLDFTPAELARYESWVRRLLGESRPAHTAYTLQILGDSGRDRNYYVGINSRLADFPPLQIDVTSRVGMAVTLSKTMSGTRLEYDTNLQDGIQLI